MKFRAAILSALLAVASLPTFALAAKPPAAGGITRDAEDRARSPTAAIRQLADAYEHESVRARRGAHRRLPLSFRRGRFLRRRLLDGIASTR
ncbi:MAG: hypothetical protein U0704_00290 [Candidatus Eisenbacteria bacterium]